MNTTNVENNFRPIVGINNHTFSNLYYDPANTKFYKKGKRKVTIEVDDYKPIPWCKIHNTYKMKSGETMEYNYTYLNLLSDDKTPVRFNEDDWAKRDAIEEDDKGVIYKV